jgi:hypothetical protein
MPIEPPDAKPKPYERVERPLRDSRTAVWLTAELGAALESTLDGGGAIRLTEEITGGRHKNSIITTLRGVYQRDGILVKIRQEGDKEGALLVWFEHAPTKGDAR